MWEFICILHLLSHFGLRNGFFRNGRRGRRLDCTLAHQGKLKTIVLLFPSRTRVRTFLMEPHSKMVSGQQLFTFVYSRKLTPPPGQGMSVTREESLSVYIASPLLFFSFLLFPFLFPLHMYAQVCVYMCSCARVYRTHAHGGQRLATGVFFSHSNDF